MKTKSEVLRECLGERRIDNQDLRYTVYKAMEEYATECIKAGWNLSREKMPDFDGEQMTFWRNLLPNPEQVEAIKANGLKIVNIDSHVAVWTEGEKILWALAGNVTELKPGDSLSLPSGFEFKEEERFICTGVGDPLEAKFCHTKLAGECSCEKVIFIRIVKTEVKEYTNPDESLEERRLGQLIAKHIMGWTLNPENIEAVKKVAIEFSKPESEESQTEKIICAAVWFQDGQTTYIHQPKNISSGYVVAGRRHHNCFTLHAMLTGVGQKAESVQGFLTDTDRFVDRKEAMEIAKQSGQVPKSQSFEELYSEDLY